MLKHGLNTAFQRMWNGVTPPGVLLRYSDLVVVQSNNHQLLFQKCTVVTKTVYFFVSTIAKDTTPFQFLQNLVGLQF
jgi:hypothetical protein